MNSLFSIKAIQLRKDSVSTNGARKVGYPHAKKGGDFHPYFTPYTKTNSKSITNLKL